MVEQGLSYRDVGRLLGVSKQAAHQRLRGAVDAELDRRAEHGLEAAQHRDQVARALDPHDGSHGYQARRLPQDQEAEP